MKKVKVITIGNNKVVGDLLDKDEIYVHLVNAKVYRTKTIEDWSKYSIPMDLIDEIEDMEE